MLLKILRSPYFISVLLVVGVYLIIRPEFPKYIIKPTAILSEAGSKENKVYTYDLDNDKSSEFIKFKSTILGESAIAVYKNNLVTIGQWNLAGNINVEKRALAFGDYDSNGFSEVYYLTIYHESLLINYIEPLLDRNAEADSAKLCDFLPGTPIEDISLNINRIADLDGDGQKEIIITAKVGYNLYPRSVYIFYPDSKKVLSYSNNYNNLFCSELLDLNNDGSPELFFDSRSPSNSKISDPIHENDNYVNAFVLDLKKPDRYSSLKRIFAPHGYIRMIPFKSYNDTLILGLASYQFSQDPVIYAWNINGELTDSVRITLEEYPDGWQPGIFKHKFGLKALIASPRGYVYQIDEDLSVNRVGEYEAGWKFRKSFDINEDGQTEYIGIQDESSLVIYTDNFREKAGIEIPRVENVIDDLHFSMFYYKGEPYLHMQNIALNKIYSFDTNWLHWGQYLIVLLAVMILYGLIFVIQYQQKKLHEKVQKEKDEITRLQFQAIANQINPHFSYNILNTIGYSVLHEEREKAYKLLVKYSTLTRNLIEGGVKPDRTLNEEIGFVENYLELQKSRWEDSFSFNIDINPDVDRGMFVPRMILLTFVENAIKHGLTSKEGDRLLKIRIYKDQSGVEAVIEDNGVGRCKEQERKEDSAGQGLKILDRIIDIHRKLHKNDIGYSIEDIENPGNNGTRVVIRL